MTGVIISLLALFASLALLIAGSAMLGTLVPLRLADMQVSGIALGIVLASYSVGFVLGATHAGQVIRNVGHIRAFAAFAAIACAVTLLHPMYISMASWALLRGLMGFCLAGLMMVTESWINDRATSESRGKLLGFYTINFYLASAAGQLLIGIVDPAAASAFSMVAILVVLSLVPLSLTRGLVPMAPVSGDSMAIRRLARQAPAGVTGVLVAGIVLSAFLALGPLYARRQGLDTLALSQYMAVSVAAAVLLQWPAGWLSDRVGRLPVLLGLLLSGALSALLMLLLGGVSFAAMFIFTALFFAVATALYPVAVALANDQLPNEELLGACGGLLRLYGLGTVIGPLLAAWAMGWFGAGALFALIALVMLLAALAVQYRFRAVDTVPLAEQGDYAPVVPVSSPVIVEIDPRNEEFSAHHDGEPADWDIADHIEMLLPDDAAAPPLNGDDAETKAEK